MSKEQSRSALIGPRTNIVEYDEPPVVPQAERAPAIAGSPAPKLPSYYLTAVLLQFQPMPLQKRGQPLDDPDWLFELKYDGFRALVVIEHGRTQLFSRNGHPFASSAELAESISDSLPDTKAVIDGGTDW